MSFLLMAPASERAVLVPGAGGCVPGAGESVVCKRACRVEAVAGFCPVAPGDDARRSELIRSSRSAAVAVRIGLWRLPRRLSPPLSRGWRSRPGSEARIRCRARSVPRPPCSETSNPCNKLSRDRPERRSTCTAVRLHRVSQGPGSAASRNRRVRSQSATGERCRDPTARSPGPGAGSACSARARAANRRHEHWNQLWPTSVRLRRYAARIMAAQARTTAMGTRSIGR